MSKLLANFRNTVILSLLLSAVLIYVYGVHWSQNTGVGLNTIYWQAVVRWFHVVFGILWIGLLWYFNFVQIRKMPDIPAELKPAVSKYIAPEALFWFRWAALLTVLAGIVLAAQRGYLVDALALDAANGFANRANTLIGIGMWLAIIMAINVWVFIWPNQKIALGIGVDADADAKAKAGRTAMLFSRTNLLLSFPMLVTMAMHQTITAGG
jgi:uncharacterized membrane protein